MPDRKHPLLFGGMDMGDFISKYIINHEAAMSEEWTDYDRFWTVSCLLLSFFGLVIAMLVR